jgi:molybdenum cofactor synthesis domain-containing protein
MGSGRPERAGEWNLLEKTELRIEHVELGGADLTTLARTVADVLGVSHDEVIVIDARDNLLALDILRGAIDPYLLVGKRDALLEALAGVAGVKVSDRTDVCAEGMLGWIGNDAAEATAALDRSREMAVEIDRRIASRAIVFSTGPEVISGQIRDTNKPWIVERLRAARFAASHGEDLPDDGDAISGALREAIEERGFGLVITTGGVGAEGKDSTIEALVSVDPLAATPAIFEVEAGRGRHVKAEVRIGVGKVGNAVIACLPGPHAEAQLGVEALLAGLARGADQRDVADEIVACLRDRLRRTHSVSH